MTPREWKYVIKRVIHKKGGGDVMICVNYRAVTLLCRTYTIVAGTEIS
jgi:hypothetical protein